MRCFIISLVFFVCAVPGYATIDPDPDHVGVYFDTNADEVCLNVPPASPFIAYVVITNPTSAGVWGVELSLCTEVPAGYESMLFRFAGSWPSGCSGPIIPEWDICLDGLIIGCGEPMPQVGANVIVYQSQYMILADFTVDFFLGPASSQSIEDGLPAYLGDGDVVIPLGVSSGSVSLPVASVNGDCQVVPTEKATFERVKCLYR